MEREPFKNSVIGIVTLGVVSSLIATIVWTISSGRSAPSLGTRPVATGSTSEQTHAGKSNPPRGTIPTPIKPTPAAPPVVVDRTSTRIGDFLFAIHDCKRAEQAIECSGQVTNKAERSRGLFVWVFNRTYFVDDLGHKSDDVSGLVGGQGTEKLGKMVPEARDLAPGLPVTLNLTVRGLPATATSVKLFLVTNQGSSVLGSFLVKGDELSSGDLQPK